MQPTLLASLPTYAIVNDAAYKRKGIHEALFGVIEKDKRCLLLFTDDDLAARCIAERKLEGHSVVAISTQEEMRQIIRLMQQNDFGPVAFDALKGMANYIELDELLRAINEAKPATDQRT